MEQAIRLSISLLKCIICLLPKLHIISKPGEVRVGRSAVVRPTAVSNKMGVYIYLHPSQDVLLPEAKDMAFPPPIP